MTRCPHSEGSLVCCARCVQSQIEPPKQTSPDKGRKTPKHRRPRAWIAVLPGGKTFTFERVGKSTARRALRQMTGKRAPTGTRWEAK